MKTEQHSVQKGIEFGKKGEESAMKEMRNLVAKNSCFEEIDYDSLSDKKKNRALPMLVFMIVKRNGIIKSYRVANGKNQRMHHNRNEFTSPILDFYAVKYACAVAAKEERDVATLDLLSFFSQTKAEKDDKMIMVKFTRALALLLIECNSKQKRHLRRENEKWVIYARCSKIICGAINAALIAYKKLARYLRKWKFKMNLCNPCVQNTIILGSQLTLLFYVDDALLTYKLAIEVTNHIKFLDDVHSKNDSLTVTWGKMHEHLGMTLDFRRKGEVAFT